MNLASQAVRNTRLPLECHMPDRKEKYYRDRLLSYPLFPGFLSLLSGQGCFVLVLCCSVPCGLPCLLCILLCPWIFSAQTSFVVNTNQATETWSGLETFLVHRNGLEKDNTMARTELEIKGLCSVIFNGITLTLVYRLYGMVEVWKTSWSWHKPK